MTQAADSLMAVFGYKRVKRCRCKYCKQPFAPTRPGDKVCSIDCGVSYGMKAAAKVRQSAEREVKRQTRAKLDALKTLQELAKEAEAAINRLVRIRDRDKPCVSCDRSASWGGQWHASHFKSVGSNSALRFNLWNIHKACSICNNHLSGNIDEYRKRLPSRIGLERVEWLDNHPRGRRYSAEYLRRLKRIANKRASMLEKRMVTS